MLGLGLFVALVMMGQVARGATMTFVGFDSKGDPVNATATFTPGAGTLHIDLVNNLINQNDVGQNISDLSFNIIKVTGAPVTGGSLTNSSGLERTVSFKTGGGFTDGSNVSTGWVLDSTTTYHLNGLGTAANTPAHTILGSPNGSNAYANANGSIVGNKPHNAFLVGTVGFDLTIPNIDANSVITDVHFSFGTTPGDNGHAPEPASITLLGIGIAGMAAYRWRRRKA